MSWEIKFPAWDSVNKMVTFRLGTKRAWLIIYGLSRRFWVPWYMAVENAQCRDWTDRYLLWGRLGVCWSILSWES